MADTTATSFPQAVEPAHSPPPQYRAQEYVPPSAAYRPADVPRRPLPLPLPLPEQRREKPRQRWSRKWLWVLAVAVALAVALAVGLGAGIGISSHNNSASSSAASSAPDLASTTHGTAATVTTESTTSTTEATDMTQSTASTTEATDMTQSTASTTTASEATDMSSSLASSQEGTATSYAPEATQTTFAYNYCVPSSNKVASPRFDNLSDWDISNGVHHFERILYHDRSPAGVICPHGDFNELDAVPALASQNLTGLEVGKTYSYSFWFAVQKRLQKPINWPYSTLNFSLLLSPDDTYSGGVTVSLDSDDVMTGMLALSDTAVYGRQANFTAQSTDLFVRVAEYGRDCDLVLFYVAVYDGADMDCDVSNEPYYYSSYVDYAYDLYAYDNSTIADSYCVPDTNIVGDARFADLGTGDSWTQTAGVSEFVRTVFEDDSPAGVVVPHADYGSAPQLASIEQKLIVPEAGAQYRIMFSYQYARNSTGTCSDVFNLTVLVAGDQTYASPAYSFSTAQYVNSSNYIAMVNEEFTAPSTADAYVKVEAASCVFDIYIFRVSIYSTSDLTCNSVDPQNPVDVIQWVS